MYVLQELPYIQHIAKFSGKFAFGFFKNNMIFPGPKETNMYLLFNFATQYVLTEILNDFSRSLQGISFLCFSLWEDWG